MSGPSPSTVSLVREHLDVATNEELGARIRAHVERGTTTFGIEPKPESTCEFVAVLR